MPITPRLRDDITGLSLPVAFQNPAAVARLVRVPLGYLRSLKLKKYHSDDDWSS